MYVRVAPATRGAITSIKCMQAEGKIRHNATEFGPVNPLREFLSAPRPTGPCKDQRFYVLFEQGAQTPQSEMVRALQSYMKLTHAGLKVPTKWLGDEVNPLYEMGFERKQLAVCKACRQHHKKGCCEFYSSRNKTTETMWLGLRLMTLEP